MSDEFSRGGYEPRPAAGGGGGGGGASGTPIMITDLPYDAASRAAAIGAEAGASNYTLGWAFQVVRAGLKITGIKFFWAPSGTSTIRCRLYNANGTEAARKDVVVNGPGLYTATFDSAVTPTLHAYYYAAVYESTGSKNTNSFTDPCAPGVPVSTGYIVLKDACYASGEAAPTNLAGGSLAYAVTPVFGEA